MFSLLIRSRSFLLVFIPKAEFEGKGKGERANFEARLRLEKKEAPDG